MGSDQKARSSFEPRVWDARHRLPSAARDDLERQLTAAERTAGVPLFLVVTDRVQGEPIAAWAARTFAERALGDDPGRNAVLLAVALDGGAAAVETGKGNAGIVPEIDARRIVKELSARLSARNPERAIATAVSQLAASSRATAARRTPLPVPTREERDEAPVAEAREAGSSLDAAVADGAVASGAGVSSKAGDGGVASSEEDPAARRRGRSRLPMAIGLGVLVLVGLALRRRRQVAASRPSDVPDRRRSRF